MQPFNGSIYEGLVNRWYQAAKNHEAGTTFKMELFDETERAVSTLERLVREGSTEQAKQLANTILQTFDSHKIGEWEELISWIGANTIKWGNDVKGAHKAFHHLFEVLQAVEIANAHRPQEDSKWNLSGLHYPRTLAVPAYIDSGVTSLLVRSDVYIHVYKNIEEPIFPSEILNLIVHNSVRENPVEDSMALRQTSKKVRQQVANAYRGPLKELNITTADQAIEYAKEFGKELRYLDISGIDFSYSNKLKELIKYLPKLETFLALNSELHKEGTAAIASSEFMKNLTVLNLSSNKIRAAGAKEIASSEFMKNLTRLELGYNRIGDDGAKNITSSKYMKNLTALNLSSNQISAAGAEEIASSEFMKNLTTLDLSYNRIGAAGAKDIASSEFMKNLTSLNIKYNQIEAVGAKEIASSEFMKNLTALNLRHNQIGDAGAKDIVSSKFMKNLTALNLNYNQIGAAGAKEIASSEFMKNLTTIELRNNQIRDVGAKDIASSEYMKNLTVLDLRNNQIRAGAKDIAASEYLKKARLIL